MEDKMWYDEALTHHMFEGSPDENLVLMLREEAKVCLESDTASYNIKSSKNRSDINWLKTAMSDGARSDKIAAYIVAILQSPIHSMAHLTKLIDTIKVGKKRDGTVAMEDTANLFLEHLLPPNRKLIPFRMRPLDKLSELTGGNGFARKKYLATWYFEDELKESYAAFIKAIDAISHDTVDTNKEKALSCMFNLLAGNPEQEKSLLNKIVNKLGDPSRKVASKATYCLTQLLKKHPSMQGVVASAIESLLFRQNISSKAQYYALCFLTQFHLSHESSAVACKLIELYFSFFKACVKQGDVNSRMMSALLVGVNRAYPYAKLDMSKISDHVDTIYRIVHVANFNISLHALSLLFQVSSSSNSLGDRFYSALYKKLLDPEISTTTHQAMLLSLIYKALQSDSKPERVKVMIKRLLQNALQSTPAVACGILFLVSQVIFKKRNANLHALVFNSPSLQAPVALALEKKDRKNTNENKEIGSDNIVLRTDKYDPFNRNPLYAGGKFVAYEELDLLRAHFHPTVALFARNLASGERVNYTGDPLKDFGLMRFLERFTNKNPKKTETTEERKGGVDPIFGIRKRYVPQGVRAFSIDSAKYANQKEDRIPVEELFLYSHAQLKWTQKEAEGKRDEEDLESVNSEEFEDMLDRMVAVNENEDEKENLDYMNEVEGNFKAAKKEAKKRKRNEDETEDLSGDEGDDDDISLDEDEGSDIDDADFADLPSEEEENKGRLEMTEEDRELVDFSDDEDEGSDIVFNSDEEEEDHEENTSKKNKRGKGKKGKFSDLPTFMAPEELAALLEEEGSSKIAPGSSGAWSNKDKANTQQIDWEDKRNRWVKGHSNKSKRKGQQGGGGKKKNFQKAKKQKLNKT